MAKGAGASPKEETTRDRILRAAIVQFANNSYESTGLRDVATAVGVDVAYVHRCFGSKEALFAECVRATMKDHAEASSREALIDALVQNVVSPDMAKDVRPLDIFVRSCSSPDASRALRENAPDFLKGLSDEGDEPSHLRATMAMALLAGASILKNVVEVRSLSEVDEDALTQLISRTVREILSADTPTAQ
ncbi:TetR family transcriptional regulator [Kaistia sp. 32K]|uniref:TetR/AcrR family transcriptional regulator n=1 Tax=Kaistia sp. 32K TaxID=2795690 RepID=UPI00191587C5|nr:TetR/AcrR family transcriptional regulator [Kaistia sp. 32K]BCP52401.1 TetR family transcriptional regulator [Kaistia sp. 32K]